MLYNCSSEPFYIQPGDRISQLVIEAIHNVEFQEKSLGDLNSVPEPSEVGFGSTGLTQADLQEMHSTHDGIEQTPLLGNSSELSVIPKPYECTVIRVMPGGQDKLTGEQIAGHVQIPEKQAETISNISNVTLYYIRSGPPTHLPMLNTELRTHSQTVIK